MNEEGVVLLHGLARTARSMRPLQQALGRAGYPVTNIGYPSTRHPLEELAHRVAAELRHRLPQWPARLHYVTHSMGGILLRVALREGLLPPPGRVVMLAPPSQGSELVDRLGGLRLFRWINGPAGLQLGTGPESLPIRLGPADFELGIITGTRAYNPLFARWLAGPSDGKVSVARARLEGMRDFLALPVTHTFLMGNHEVIVQTLHFLQHGCFARDGVMHAGSGG